MKLLIIVSSLDLTQPFSATPAWWQLLKGLYEENVELLVTTYQGPAIESLWWRALPNPVKREGDLFKGLRDLSRRFASSDGPSAKTLRSGESVADRAQRQIAQKVIAPRWRSCLNRTLTVQPDIDAVIFLTIPLNHVVGLASFIREKFNKPVIYYDGDVPGSLPAFAGFASGFKIYQGANVAEYDAFISNSAGGADLLREMGARAAHVLYYGADPDIFAPLDVPQDIDVFFNGHGKEYREDWIDAMITQPSRELPDAKFAVRGHSLGDVGNAKLLPYLSFSKLREYVSRTKINLVVTRKAHTSVFASSSSRPFELAGYGACMVSNPYPGLETWFEPDKEMVIINSHEEAVERYRWLLAHDTERKAMGQAARQRLLNEHTFRHRARQLVTIVQQYL